MRLIVLICVTMVAFAANSVLNRMAVGPGRIDPASFAIIRVAAGAAMLGLLVQMRGGGLQLWTPNRWIGALSLSVYMIGFSLAYLTLDAGLGALILFGTVQIGMFAWSAFTGTQPNARALTGAAVAFGGLLVALWPAPGAAFGLGGAALMICAGLGWAAYTLNGRGVANPLAETGANFIVSLPLMLLLLLVPGKAMTGSGVLLAVISGAVTSGLGYALWYAVLPRLAAQSAAVIQLSVPIIAIAGGAVILGEVLSLKLALAAALVIGGIAWAVTAPPSQARRS